MLRSAISQRIFKMSAGLLISFSSFAQAAPEQTEENAHRFLRSVLDDIWIHYNLPEHKCSDGKRCISSMVWGFQREGACISTLSVGIGGRTHERGGRLNWTLVTDVDVSEAGDVTLRGKNGMLIVGNSGISDAQFILKSSALAARVSSTRKAIPFVRPCKHRPDGIAVRGRLDERLGIPLVAIGAEEVTVVDVDASREPQKRIGDGVYCIGRQLSDVTFEQATGVVRLDSGILPSPQNVVLTTHVDADQCLHQVIVWEQIHLRRPVRRKNRE